ncbi:hypothetical protein DF186_17225, partial [Enterococcus hirae]
DPIVQVAVRDAQGPGKLLPRLAVDVAQRDDPARHVDRSDRAADGYGAIGVAVDVDDAILGRVPDEILDRVLALLALVVDQGARLAAVG